MKKVKVVFDRHSCIGAAVCNAIAPKFWVMADDGKADLVGGKVNDSTGNFELETQVSEEEYRLLQDSARSCPVMVIQVLDQ